MWKQGKRSMFTNISDVLCHQQNHISKATDREGICEMNQSLLLTCATPGTPASRFLKVISKIFSLLCG